MREREQGTASLTGLLLYFVVVFEPGDLRLGDAVGVTVQRGGAADGHGVVAEIAQQVWRFLIWWTERESSLLVSVPLPPAARGGSETHAGAATLGREVPRVFLCPELLCCGQPTASSLLSWSNKSKFVQTQRKTQNYVLCV